MDALAMCDNLKGGPEEDLYSCYSGVFSQLDQDLAKADVAAVAEVSAEIRSVSSKDPYTYCMTLDQKYRRACYTELAQRYVKRMHIQDRRHANEYPQPVPWQGNEPGCSERHCPHLRPLGGGENRIRSGRPVLVRRIFGGGCVFRAGRVAFRDL